MDETAVISYMEDPALALDGDWRVVAANDAFAALVGDESIEGHPVTDMFDTDEALAHQHADLLAHYTDIGGVVEGDRRHFDPDHETVAALHDHRDPRDGDPDVGVFVDGDLQYFHLNTVPIEDSETHLLVCRDVTRLKDNERDLDFLRQVMGRVLRHNLRNDISVIQGQATAIEEMADDECAKLARGIHEKCDDLVETSEKARLIERAVESDRRTGYDLKRVIDDGIDHARAAAESESPTIETDVPAVDVLAVPSFEDALHDTIENAVVYSEGGEVEITGAQDGQWVTLSVADDGPGIPDHELEAVERRGETDLVHGSGAGLWLIYTTVRESGGNVTVDTDDGTTVTLRLPVAGE